jgi:hypothetical protein
MSIPGRDETVVLLTGHLARVRDQSNPIAPEMFGSYRFSGDSSEEKNDIF